MLPNKIKDRLFSIALPLTIAAATLSSCQGVQKTDDARLQGAVTSTELVPKSPEDIRIFFHPYPEDSTFKPIAEWVRDPAYKRIDIAMYSMEVDSQKSEIIKAIMEQSDRIKSGDLKVRMIFQGYKKPCQKCIPLERIGIDIRQIRSKSVHHKFGVFYGPTKSSVMTGSGNWSTSSNTMYDENMLFINNHPNLASRYIGEFQKLWKYHEDQRPLSSDEQALNADEDPANDVWDDWGNDLGYLDHDLTTALEPEAGIEVIFNSDNYVISPTRAATIRPKKFTLTNRLIELIDSAQETIHMATPRITLRPVYEALIRAAGRGVKISLMSTEAEYPHRNNRNDELIGKLYSCDPKKVLDQDGQPIPEQLKSAHGRCCSRTATGELTFDTYVDKCSTGQNHIRFLNEQDYPGKENMNIHLKLYTWYPRSQSIAKQMHAKFTIVDKKMMMAGSFNYSYNSEYKLFENVVLINGNRYPKTIATMLEKFDRIYSRNRGQFADYQVQFEEAHKNMVQIDCPPLMFSLTYEEIDTFLATRTRHKKFNSLKEACSNY
jgi:phosphatidylserine/phosphatidylglycerophosphate/cardiolipin synthase-like enzyme